jgi:hypothetical protein
MKIRAVVSALRCIGLLDSCSSSVYLSQHIPPLRFKHSPRRLASSQSQTMRPEPGRRDEITRVAISTTPHLLSRSSCPFTQQESNAADNRRASTSFMRALLPASPVQPLVRPAQGGTASLPSFAASPSAGSNSADYPRPTPNLAQNEPQMFTSAPLAIGAGNGRSPKVRRRIRLTRPRRHRATTRHG